MTSGAVKVTRKLAKSKQPKAKPSEARRQIAQYIPKEANVFSARTIELQGKQQNEKSQSPQATVARKKKRKGKKNLDVGDIGTLSPVAV